MADTTQLAQQAIDSVNQLKEMADQAGQNQAAYEELYEENTRLNSEVDSLKENLSDLSEVFHQKVIEEDDYLSYAEDMLKDISNMIDNGELSPLSIEKAETLRMTLWVVASSLAELLPDEKTILAEAGGYGSIMSLEQKSLFVDGGKWVRSAILRNIEEVK